MKKKLMGVLILACIFLVAFPHVEASAATTKTIKVNTIGNKKSPYSQGAIYVNRGEKVDIYVSNPGNDVVRARVWQGPWYNRTYFYNYWIKIAGSRSNMTPAAGWVYFDLECNGVTWCNAEMTVRSHK